MSAVAIHWLLFYSLLCVVTLGSWEGFLSVAVPEKVMRWQVYMCQHFQAMMSECPHCPQARDKVK